MNQLKNAIVCFEDRPDHETGVKLLILSLLHHKTAAEIIVFLPHATDAFKHWAEKFDIRLVVDVPTHFSHFNIKADLILWALENGFERAAFIDADIVLTKALPQELFSSPEQTLVTAEVSPLHRVRTKLKTEFWGYTSSRSFIRDPSACCISATKYHRQLLLDWNALIQDPRYVEAQNKRKTGDTNLHPALQGSDALLAALLGSTKHSPIPLITLSSKSTIAQCGAHRSFTITSRLVSLISDSPTMIHAVGKKPWRTGQAQSLSPYAIVAKQYCELLDEPGDWLTPQQNELSLWQRTFQNQFALATFWLAVRESARSFGIRQLFKNAGYYIAERFNL